MCVRVWSRTGATGSVYCVCPTGAPLLHSITISGARTLIFEEDLREALSSVRKSLEPSMLLVSYCGTAAFAGLGDEVNLTAVLPSLSSRRPLRVYRAGVKPTQPFSLVYTSGTTGMPKAAVISHVRAYLMSSGLFNMFALRPEDSIYTVLPLYHSAGGTVGVGCCLFQGCTIILRDRYAR
jgi:acyl-CoA synthetase (AMP-forming)/AMP-acid ligase II